ncbi:uncharacterized protein [Eleutherodactylus coqui]|uniref:uncharacterized protein n=1 Tax=Eleutherodactylus coqui TaxID=57060 RepID=UPI003462E0D2
MSTGPPINTDSQAFPVDIAMCSMGTQTEDVSTSETPTVNLSSLRSESIPLENPGNEKIFLVSNYTSSAEKTSVDLGPSSDSQERKALFDNPLESLPKCAPFSPAIVRTLSVTSEVATMSKTASVYMRSTMIVPSPILPNTCPENPIRNGMNLETGLGLQKCTVSTQTCDPPAPQQLSFFHAAESLESKDDASPKALSSTCVKINLMENPLDKLPRSPPCRPAAPAPTTVQLSESKTNAVAAVSAVVGAQARLSDPFVYRSLLDALIIEPVIKQPFPSSNLGRRSTGLIGIEQLMRLLKDIQVSE